MLKLMKPKKYITTNVGTSFIQKIFEKSKDFFEYDEEEHELILAYMGVGRTSQEFDEILGLLRLLATLFSDGFRKVDYRMSLHILNQMQFYLKNNYLLNKNQQLYQNMVQLYNDIVKEIDSKEKSDEGFINIQVQIQQQILEIENYYNMQKMPADQTAKRNRPGRRMNVSNHLTSYSVNAQMLRMLARNRQYMDVLVEDSGYRKLITDNVKQMSSKIMMNTWISMFLEKLNEEQKTVLEKFVKEQNLFLKQREKYGENVEINIETLLRSADFKQVKEFLEALRQYSEAEIIKENIENVMLEKYQSMAEIDADSHEYQIREYIDLIRRKKALSGKEIQELEEAWLEYKEEINQIQEVDEVLDELHNRVIQEIQEYLETAGENEKKDVLEQVQADPILVKRYADYFVKQYLNQNSEEFYQALSEYFENQGNTEFSKLIQMFLEKDDLQVNKYLNDCKKNIQMYYEQFARRNHKENQAFVEQLINQIDMQPEGMPWKIILEKDTANSVFEEYIQDIKTSVSDWQDTVYQNLYVQLQKSQQEIFSTYQSRINEEYLNVIEKVEYPDIFGRMLLCYMYDKEAAEETLYTILENFIKEQKDFHEIYKTVSDKILDITEKRKPQIITAYADYMAKHFGNQQEEILFLVNKTIEILPEAVDMDIDYVYMDKMSEVLQMQEIVQMFEMQPVNVEQVVHRLIECEQICSKHNIQEILYRFEPESAVYKSEVKNQIEQMDKDMLSAFSEMIINTVREGQSGYTSSFITLAENLEKIYYGLDFQNNETDILNVQQAFKNYYQQNDIKDLTTAYQMFFGERSETREDIFDSFLNNISKYELVVLEELAGTFSGVSEECKQLSEKLLHTHQQYSKVIEKYILQQSQWQKAELLKIDFVAVLKEKLSQKQAAILSKQYLQLIDSYLNEWYQQTVVSKNTERINQVSKVLVQQIVESMYHSAQKIDDFVTWYLEEPLLEHLRQFADDTQLSKNMEELFTEISGKVSFTSKETPDEQITGKQNWEEVENILQSSELWKSYLANQMDSEILKNRYCLRVTKLLEDKLQMELFYQVQEQTYQYNYRIRKLLQEVMSVQEEITSIKLEQLTDEVYNQIIQKTEAVDVIRYLEKVQKIQKDMENYIEKYILDVQLSDNNPIYELIRSSVYMSAVSEEQFMKMILTDTAASDILKNMQDKNPIAKEEIAVLLQGQPKLMVLREFSQRHALEEQYRRLIQELNGMFRQYFLQTDKRIWNEKQVLAKFQKIMFESDLYTQYVSQIRQTQEYKIVCKEAVKYVSRQIYEQFITDETFIQKILKMVQNQEVELSTRMQESLITFTQKHIYYEKHKISQIVQSILTQNPVYEILNNLKQKSNLEEYQLLDIITNSLEENHNEYNIVYKNLKHIFLKPDIKEELTQEYGITYEDFENQLTQMILKNPVRNRYAEIGKSVELYKHYRDSVENSLAIENYSKEFFDMVYKSNRLYSVSDLLHDTYDLELVIHDNQNVENVSERQIVQNVYKKYLEHLTEKPMEILTEEIYRMQPGYVLFNRNVYIKSYGKRNLRVVVPKMRHDEYEVKYDLLHLQESQNDLVYEIEEYQNSYRNGNSQNYQLNFALPVYDEKEYMSQEVDEQINSLKQQVQKASEEIENMKNIHIQMDKEFLHRSEKEVIERELIQKIDDDIVMAGKRHGIY